MPPKNCYYDQKRSSFFSGDTSTVFIPWVTEVEALVFTSRPVQFLALQPGQLRKIAITISGVSGVYSLTLVTDTAGGGATDRATISQTITADTPIIFDFGRDTLFADRSFLLNDIVAIKLIPTVAAPSAVIIQTEWRYELFKP